MRRQNQNSRGFSLFELITTLAVLAVMVLGAIPLLQNSVKRQKEQDLRETLRDIRLAIDEFKRDTAGACQGNVASSNLPAAISGQKQSFDPRSRLMIDDCTIFTADNLDRYPPTLETLVDGVKVKSRNQQTGGAGSNGKSIFDQPNATEINASEDKVKIYLRKLPIDPFTGKSDWNLRSSFQDKDASDWDKVNVFDVRSKAEGESMSGEKYSDW